MGIANLIPPGLYVYPGGAEEVFCFYYLATLVLLRIF